jgi:bacterial/archaeal transporter family protein
MNWLLVAIIVLSTSIANVLKSLGMRRYGEMSDFRPRELAKALVAVAQNRLVLVAVLMDTISFLAFIALLSVAELSFAVPATAGVFVLDTIFARILLNESVSWKRWVGVLFITCGIGVLSR